MTTPKISLAPLRGANDVDRVQWGVSASQRETCQHEALDAQVHSALALLNTSPTCARVWAENLRIVPSRCNNRAGDFPNGHSRTPRAVLPLNRADCVKAGCSLIRHVQTRSVCPHGSAQRSLGAASGRRAPKTGLSQVGRVVDGIRAKAQRMNCQSTRRTSIQSESRSDPSRRWGESAQKYHKCTTSRELRITEQAVGLRARAAGKARPKGRCISSQLGARRKPRPGKSMVAPCLYEPRSMFCFALARLLPPLPASSQTPLTRNGTL